MRTARILVGDVRARLRELPDASVQTCITSPPYWGLRDYGHTGQIGLESSPAEFVRAMCEVFAEVWRVLRDDGTCWINLGDSYANDAKWGGHTSGLHVSALHSAGGLGRGKRETGLKSKDLVGIPWRVAFALQADGWYLRSDIIWSKPNPMPESVTDRPTKAHEYIFLLTKSERYYFDAEAIKEPVTGGAHSRGTGVNPKCAEPGKGIKQNGSFSAVVNELVSERNKRSVWHVATQPYPEAHFATYPEALIEPCILAGTSEKGQCPQCGAAWARMIDVESRPNAPSLTGKYDGQGKHRTISGGVSNDARERREIGWQPTCQCNAGEPIPQTVLDPFCGSGTTGVVACRHNRSFIGVELNPTYAALAERRILGDAALFNRVEVSA